MTSTDRTVSAPMDVPLRRLRLLKLGYLVVAVGLVVAKWPLIVTHATPWPLYEGVETCMLVAMSLLAFVGLRHPLKMLPVLLFELAWKILWVSVVVLPLWVGGRLDPATETAFYTCLVVLIVAAVIPWRYVVAQFVTSSPDRPVATHPCPVDDRATAVGNGGGT